MPKDSCLNCEHAYFSQGCPGYSEWTPGWEAELYYVKGHWQFDAYNEGKGSLRKKLYMAKDCADFKEEQE